MGAQANPVELTTGAVEPAPRHVAIIMDGNGRWARARGLPRTEGHRRGIEAVRRAVRFAGSRGIETLTLFSFSSENWSRPAAEVEDLLNLLRLFIRRDLNELKSNGVRIRVIGERAGLPGDILGLINQAENETENNNGLCLVVAFNYSGRDELVRCARRIARQALESGIEVDEIDYRTVESALDTTGLPDPDLIVRTSGEK